MTKTATTKTKISRMQPTAIGAGLLALDVVVSNDDVNNFAGGTCGNVLTVLSYLGWKSMPVARLKNDVPASLLLEDLSNWDVDTSFVTTTDDGSTPVIIQRIKEDAEGNPVHSFSLRCPCCSSYLPGYKSILGSAANELMEVTPEHQVFFLDRVSRGTLTLAEDSAKRGALVVFEPSGIGEPRLFREAWALAHVVKYSNDRLRDIADLDLKSVRNSLLLEIETLGSSGLRFRSRLQNAESSKWKTLAAIDAPLLKDAAGSGDWCTAGLIHKLSRGGLKGFKRSSNSRLLEALRYGQALAAWNCGYEGARGGMYQVTTNQFEHKIRRLVAGKSIRLSTEEPVAASDDLRSLCPTCEAVEFSSKNKSASA